MTKILISPLGTGRSDAQRLYQTATYHLNEQEYQSSFIASVLYKNLGLDGIIFIGTVKSMWEEVYRFFCEEKQEEWDEKYWLELAEKIEGANSNTPLNSLDLEPVKQVLGKRSHCILINYGLNESEIWQNFDKIIQLINYLHSGDEIYIDITHSFRSLSLFLFLVLVFLKDIYSQKQIKVAGVYYGMLDVHRELGYAPIVNLQSLFEITDWTKGTYSLQSYGDSSLITQLLSQQGNSLLAQDLQRFSDALNLGYLPSIKEQAKSLQTSLKRPEIAAPFKYLKQPIAQFLNNFGQIEHESEMQLELASWYFQHQRYATGYLIMTEAILTYLCEINQKNPDSEQDRKLVKDLMFRGKYRNSRLSKLYKQVNEIRKNVAHPQISSREHNFTHDIKKAFDYQQELKQIFETGEWEVH